MGRPSLIQTNAPKSVEITVFDQPEHKRLIIHLFSFQQDLPNIPIDSIQFRVRLDSRKPVRVSRLPDGKVLDFVEDGKCVEFVALRLETYLMIRVEYA
jgi:hypothetical protein